MYKEKYKIQHLQDVQRKAVKVFCWSGDSGAMGARGIIGIVGGGGARGIIGPEGVGGAVGTIEKFFNSN